MYKLNKIIIINSALIVVLLLAFRFGMEDFNKNKLYNEDKEYVYEQNISSIDNEVSKDTNEDSNDGDFQNREDINIATNKQDLVYTSYENDLYADNAKEIENMLNKWNYLREDGKKIAYLTFDDGPSTEVTQEILETLKSNNIKATFFVLGSNVEKSNEQKELLKEMVMEGHAVGNHGYCHDYSILYPSRVANPTVVINDMKKSEEAMKAVLGDDFRTSVIRLPGGHMSWNTKSLDPLLEENGYSYIDWNALNGDAESNDRTAEQLVNRLKGTIRDLAGNDDVLVILMHDTNAKKTTAQSLQEVIDYLKSLGYEFRTLK
ncbi:MAG: polysaccharide deacetylase family protein [Clostridium celatum]|nr:polysaccharide deacetylase family protein [Clostridium celatum]MDU2490986.1 polysaccharide deacetylase family protein [Clostridium celatum]MDU4979442.1 polysaccharide deacetylase family protein [Clostridium celatum]